MHVLRRRCMFMQQSLVALRHQSQRISWSRLLRSRSIILLQGLSWYYPVEYEASSFGGAESTDGLSKVAASNMHMHARRLEGTSLSTDLRNSARFKNLPCDCLLVGKLDRTVLIHCTIILALAAVPLLIFIATTKSRPQLCNLFLIVRPPWLWRLGKILRWLPWTKEHTPPYEINVAHDADASLGFSRHGCDCHMRPDVDSCSQADYLSMC